MGLGGILASVFIPPQISPDANLMEKHRSVEIRLQGGEGGWISAPPIALLSLANLSLIYVGLRRAALMSWSRVCNQRSHAKT